MTSAPWWGVIRWVGAATLFGAVPPLVGFVADILIGSTTPKGEFLRAFVYSLSGILTLLWPTSILMAATQGAEHTTYGHFVFLLSTLSNMGLYGVLGAMAWLLYSMACRLPQVGA